jgi:hypothetical protein
MIPPRIIKAWAGYVRADSGLKQFRAIASHSRHKRNRESENAVPMYPAGTDEKGARRFGPLRPKSARHVIDVISVDRGSARCGIDWGLPDFQIKRQD